jgi:Protein of unknown function (DUF1559)
MTEETASEEAAHRCSPMNYSSGPPSAFSPPANRRPRFTFTIGTMMRFILVVGCLLGLLAALVPIRDRTRDAPRRAACVNNLKQIALALHQYHTVYGAFPPAYIADEQGRPRHSWRVLILPFLEQQSLYDQYDFREPWDGPNNIKLLGQMPVLFQCPSSRAPGPAVSTFTSYVAISGPGTMFPGAESIRLDHVTDGPAKTLMVVEVAHAQIPWTKPEDLDVRTMASRINDRDHPSISSNHPGGAVAAFGDGACRFLPDSINGMGLRSLVTVAGGEQIATE